MFYFVGKIQNKQSKQTEYLVGRSFILSYHKLANVNETIRYVNVTFQISETVPTYLKDETRIVEN